MRQNRFLNALVVLVFLWLPAQALCQSGVIIAALALRDRAYTAPDLSVVEDPNIPQEMRDLMRICQNYYLQGSDLLKSGAADEARLNFDRAVDILIRSRWDLVSTPPLNQFFWDLILRIQREESLYLRPDELPEQPEEAVLDTLEEVDLIPIQVDPSLQDVVEADLLTTRYDIPIMLNDSVLKSLNYWLDKQKDLFAGGLMRSGRYREMIREIFRAESLPLDLMYLAQVESLFKTNAVSRALARGMWQFGRATAIRYGLKVDRHIDERLDPEKSTRAAARYLKDLYAMFQDWNLVLAAYNCGEGKVLQLIKSSGLNDFWDLTGLRRNFPKETRNHVPMILSSVILGRNPDKYGLPVELDPQLQYDRIKVPRRISLAAAAKTLDVEVDALKRLNPALKTAYTPANYPDYELNVPIAIEPARLEQLALLPPTRDPAPQIFDGRYKVRPGDTLWAIASRYGTTVAALQEANDIRSPKSLRVGTLLEVPAKKSPPAARPAQTQAKGPQTAASPAKP